ncbi:Frizzled-9 [Balamuthia mandrillaris]
MRERKSGAVILWLCVLLLLCSGCGWAQNPEGYEWGAPDVADATCQPWNGLPAECSEVTGFKEGDLIFIGENWTMPSHQFWSQGIFRLGTTFRDRVPPDCAESVTTLFCLTWLRPCVTVGDETLILPIQPCEDLCLRHLNICSDAFHEVLKSDPGLPFFLPPNEQFPLLCNESDYDAGFTPFWQKPRYNLTLDDGRELEFECRAPKTVLVPSDCQDPFKATVEDGVLKCGLECPLPSLTDEEYDALQALQLTFGWLSWAGSLAWIVTSLIDPKLRKYPSNLLMMSAIAAHIAAGAMILPSFGGHELWWCGEDGQVIAIDVIALDGGVLRSEFTFEDVEASSGLCTFQGTILHFGYLCSTIWWACVSLNMFLKLYFPDKLPDGGKAEKVLQWVYHVVAWGISVLFSIIPAAADRVAFPLGGTFCFISSKDEQAYLLAFWFIPVGIALGAGSAFFAASIIQIVRRALVSKKVKALLLANYSLLIFVSIFLFNYTFIFAYSIKFYQDEEEIMDQYLLFYTCMYWGDTSSNVESLGCNFDSVTMNYELLGLRGFAYASLGFLLFLALFPRKMVVRAWKKRVRDVTRSLRSTRSYSEGGSSKRTRSFSLRSRGNTANANQSNTNERTATNSEGEEEKAEKETEKAALEEGESSSSDSTA